MSDDLEATGLSVLGEARAAEIRRLIRDVPGFPHPPIVFRDITPLLADAAAFADVVEAFALSCREYQIDLVAGIEARGFLFGAPLALRLGVGFVPLRKKGKLPPPVRRATYDLEYGSDTLEVRDGTFTPGMRVLLIDDVLATGGTAVAGVELIEAADAKVVATTFLLELTGLPGRSRLANHHINTLLRTVTIS
ncbi:MAG: adenine phosphoribosyltransferase [Promicromonosporaceae bacterium]|nr:adenine phosphoribosyltransferase [Promicromonosporaceae bacterium]